MKTLPLLLLSVLVCVALGADAPPPPIGGDSQSGSDNADTGDAEGGEEASLRRRRGVVRGLRTRRDDSCGHDFPANGPITIDAFKEASLTGHNNYRAKEQGTDVLELEWDDNLAKVAQFWSDQCMWRHDHLNNCYESDNRPVGQNMFMTGGGSALPTSVDVAYYVKQWYIEKNDYNFSSTSCKDGAMCGHYTQVVWGKSHKLGCAYTMCSKVEISPDNVWNNALIFVCDYDPPGNYQNQQPYKKGGPPCSDCKGVVDNGWACEMDLCVPCTKSSNAGCHCDDPGCGSNGQFDDMSCMCVCDKGFYGAKCEHSCGCSDSYAVCGDWKTQGFCDLASYKDFMTSYCPNTCGFCPKVAACDENTV